MAEPTLEQVITGVLQEFRILSNEISAAEREAPSPSGSGISPVVVQLMGRLKKLFSVAAFPDSFPILAIHQPLITSTLQELTFATKAYNAGDGEVSAIKESTQRLLTHLQKFFNEIENPQGSIPDEYLSIFEKATQLIKELLVTIERSAQSPEKVQEDVIPLVLHFKELIAFWWESPLLRQILEDKKAVFLSQLARMVAEAREIEGPQTDVAPRASYMRTLAAMAEMLGDWFGKGYGYSLEHPVKVINKVKQRCIDRLHGNFQVALPETENDISGLDPEDRNFNTISPVPKRVIPQISITPDFFTPPPPISPREHDSPNAASPPPPLSPHSTQRSFNSLEIDSPGSRRHSSSRSIQIEPSRPTLEMVSTAVAAQNLKEMAEHVQVPTSPRKTKKLYGIGMEILVESGSGSVRNSVKWNDEYFNWKTLQKFGGLFFAVASRDFDSSGIQSKVDMISLIRGDLIAVVDDKSPDLWKGANVETGKAGCFPRHFVEIVPDSFHLFMDLPKEDLEKAKEVENSKDNTNSVLTTKAIVQAGDLKLWVTTTITLDGLKLIIGAGKLDLGTLRKKKKLESLLPVVLNLPDCNVNNVLTEGLEKKYGERTIQVLDRLTNVTYAIAIESQEQKIEWLNAISLASLTIPASESIGRATSEKLNGNAHRRRSSSIFGFKKDKESEKRTSPLPSPEKSTTEESPKDAEAEVKTKRRTSFLQIIRPRSDATK